MNSMQVSISSLALTTAQQPSPSKQNEEINRLTRIFNRHLQAEQEVFHIIKADTPEKKCARQAEIDQLFHLIRSGRLPIKKGIDQTTNISDQVRIKGPFLLIRIFVGKGRHKALSLCVNLHTLEPQAYTKCRYSIVANGIDLQKKLEKIPQIIKYTYAEIYESCHKTTLEKRYKIFLATEYCNRGSLKSYIKEAELDIGKILIILEDCLIGLSEIEKNGLCHRSIKEENILLNMTSKRILRAKIADLDALSEVNSSTDIDLYGNPCYVPLEYMQLARNKKFMEDKENAKKILKNLTEDSDDLQKCQESMIRVVKEASRVKTKQDIWAMGIVLYKLIHKHHPFYYQLPIYTEDDFYEMLKEASRVKNVLSSNSKNKKVATVLSLEETKQNFLYDLNNRMLQFDPKKRLTATECLEMLKDFKKSI